MDRCSTPSQEDTGSVSGEQISGAPIPYPPKDAGGPGSASNTESSPTQTEHREEVVPVEVRTASDGPEQENPPIAKQAPVAPPGLTVGEVERARELLLGWMNTCPAGVYQSSIQSTEFQRLIDLIADALESARAELLAQIREPSEELIEVGASAGCEAFHGLRWADISTKDYWRGNFRVGLRALADKLTEAKPRASEFATKVAASGLGDA